MTDLQADKQVLEQLLSQGDLTKSRSDEHALEQVRLESQALLAEYAALRAELVNVLDSVRQMVAITLTAIGGIIAGVPYLMDANIPTLFLVAALFFFCISLSQIRYIYFVYRIGSYIRDVISPGIRNGIQSLKPQSEGDITYIMGWEKGWRLRDRGNTMFIGSAIAHYGMPIFAAIILFSTYVTVVIQNNTPVLFVDYVLIVLNIIAIVYCVLLGFWAKRHFGN